MDAERALGSAENASVSENARTELKNLANRLIKDAESLSDMTLQNDIWS
jgi:hypothetical protein